MQHAAERVERPGESQEALDGKKVFPCNGCDGLTFRAIKRFKTNSRSIRNAP